MPQNISKSKNLPPFLKKLYTMLQDHSNETALAWSSNRVGFGILNEEILAKQVFPKYFKHSNYSSFIRQLNMYGFHKVRKGGFENYFYHDKFIQGDLVSISQIQRKPEKKKMMKNTRDQSINQIQRFYCQSQIRQQNNSQQKTINKTQITLNSVHTIKSKSQESLILMNNNLQSNSKQISGQNYDQGNRNNSIKLSFIYEDSFQNQEQMDNDSSKMSINNQLQSKSIFGNHQKEILVPSLNSLLAFINPYHHTNFGLMF